MKWNAGQKREQPPVGSHIAICYAVVDLGTRAVVWQGTQKMQRKVMLGFELPNEKMEGQYDPKLKGKNFTTHRQFTMFMGKRGQLRPFIEAWRGRAYKEEEIDSIDPKKFLGVPCRINLVASESGDYVNIDSIAPLGKGEKKPKMTATPLFFSLEESDFSDQDFAALPEHWRKKIVETPEYKRLKNEHPEPAAGEGGEGGEGGESDDVPF